MIYEQANTKAERVLCKMKKDVSILDRAVELSLYENEYAADRFHKIRDCALLAKSVFLLLVFAGILLGLSYTGILATIINGIGDETMMKVSSSI